jgi:biopolymer transport protein ExbD
MSMNVSTGSSDAPMCDVNTTPLIDVMLVLLVMLIVTLPIMTHAVKLDMPRPNDNPLPPVPPEVINIEIDYDGTIVWNGTPVPSIPTLDSFFRQEAGKDPQPEIHLRPDRRAKYNYVAEVMASAQRAKMVKMGFTNVAEFKD